MENYNQRSSQFEYVKTQSDKALMVYTFGWMFFALVISAVVAIAFNSIPALQSMLWTEGELGLKPSIFYYVAMFSPIAIVLAMNFGFHKLSVNTLILLFITYSVLIGISFSIIFLVYSLGSITAVFFSTAGVFGFMAVLGATTKTDLSKMGTLLRVALIGMLITMLINFFVLSSTLDYIISIAGVIIFTGLAAYHTQNLKELSAQSDGSVTFKKLGIISALSLYVTFINLFLFLLRLFGRRD